MSWATGFERGQRIAKGLVDTYNQAKQQGEIEKIVNEKPIDATGLSTEQNEQVFQSLADGGTARDVKNDDGSFGGVAVSKPMPEGVEGPAPAQTLAPQKITTYLGREFVGGLDPAKATSARNRALAGVITKSDPIQGMKLDAMLTQTDREDQEYGDKQKVRTLQQQLAGESDPLKKFEIGRQLAALPGGGEVVKGFGDIEQANYRAVVNHARGFMDKDDFGGAMNVYNQYDNGEDGEVVKLQGGGYQLNFYAGKPGEGNLTSSKTFKNGEEVKQWFNDRFDPEAAVKRQAESATNTLKFNNEVKKAVAIEQAKALVREGTLRPGYKWGTDENGNDIQVRADAGSGGRSVGGKAAAGSSGGIPMKDADRIIARHFTAKDDLTGSNKLNTVAAASARLLVPMTQGAAAGDAVGATYEAIQRYEAVLERAGGDHAKAAQIIRNITQQQPGAKPAAAPARPAAAAPASQGRGGVVLSKDSIDRINRGELKAVPNPFQ